MASKKASKKASKTAKAKPKPRDRNAHMMILAKKGQQPSECHVSVKDNIMPGVILVIPFGYSRSEALEAATVAQRRLSNMDFPPAE